MTLTNNSASSWSESSSVGFTEEVGARESASAACLAHVKLCSQILPDVIEIKGFGEGDCLNV